MTTSAPAQRIAYLTGEYPAVSHTFILREVEALRALGLDVLTCSVRKTGPEHHRGPSEQHAARTTFYILANARSPVRMARALLSSLKRPKRLFSAFALAWRTAAPGTRALLYQLFYLAEAIILADHLRTQGVTRLHNHFAGPSATVAMLTKELTGLPFSFTLHGPADFEDVHRWRLDEKIARADFVACISYFARSQAMLHSDPSCWEKLYIIHCGITPNLYDRPAQEAQNGKNLLFIGRLAAVKGLPVLIEAMTEALRHDPSLTLTLIGDGADRTRLEALTKPLGDRVRFTGYQSQTEVAEHLARSDALVLPSFAEGVPVVLMEAMASGIPVIATRVAGVAELVEDGVSGYLVAPGHAAELAEKIIALCDPTTPRARMGQAGREKVHAEFDISQEAMRLARLFEDRTGSTIRSVAHPPSPGVL